MTKCEEVTNLYTITKFIQAQAKAIKMKTPKRTKGGGVEEGVGGQKRNFPGKRKIKIQLIKK